MSDGGWVFSARAGRDFKRLDPPVQRRIVSALDRLTGDPPAGDVVKLANTDEWRLRVSDWRIRFERDAETGIVHVMRSCPGDEPTAIDLTVFGRPGSRITGGGAPRWNVYPNAPSTFRRNATGSIAGYRYSSGSIASYSSRRRSGSTSPRAIIV